MSPTTRLGFNICRLLIRNRFARSTKREFDDLGHLQCDQTTFRVHLKGGAASPACWCRHECIAFMRSAKPRDHTFGELTMKPNETLRMSFRAVERARKRVMCACLFVCLFACLFVCLLVCLLACLFFCLFVCLVDTDNVSLVLHDACALLCCFRLQ